MFKLNDVKAFREAFRGSQYGQLWNDPALKDFRDELGQKLDDATKALKEKIGVSLEELFELPQGRWPSPPSPGRRREELPQACPSTSSLMADAGENEKKMLEVLDRADQAGRGRRRQGLDRIVQRPDAPHRSVPAARASERREGQGEGQAAARPSAGLDQLRAACSSSPPTSSVIKDLAAHREGRDNSLAATEAFTKTQAKTDSAKSQVVWYLDVAKLIKLVIKANAKGRGRRPADRGPGPGAGRLRPQIGRRLLHPGHRELRQPHQDLLPRAQARARAAQGLLVAADHAFGPSRGCPPPSPATRP